MPDLRPLLSWLAFPVYVWQGVGVRLRTERMTPAKGPTEGHFAGAGPAIKLLALGDSSIASVGAETTDQSVAFQLAKLLNERTGRQVNWRAAGFSSAVSGQIRDYVMPNMEIGEWTHIILHIGVNDAKNFHTISRFKKEFGGLLYAMRAKWPKADIYWCKAVDFTKVPAMPPMLGQILEVRAQAVNRMGERLCHERSVVPVARLPITDPVAGFSRDGFHASAAGYEAWALHLLPVILESEGGKP